MARLPSDPQPAGRTLLTLDEARSCLTGAVSPMPAQAVPLADAVGRVLARDVVARHSQPPFDASAMDGWAVRFGDLPGPLAVVGEAAAGHPFGRALRAGETVRIGTGAPLPEGADHVLIQEEAAREGDTVRATAQQERPRNVRSAGRDFATGAMLLAAGTRIEPRHVGLIAASGTATVAVRRRPRVGVFTSGDELVAPGDPLGPARIVDSARHGLPALIAGWGGEGIWLSRTSDRVEDCISLWAETTEVDLIVTVGGASVGDRDLLRSSLESTGGRVEWAGVAIRPGKPAWFGRAGDLPVLGLPGNPTAALVAARLLLAPMLNAWLDRDCRDAPMVGRLAEPMAANGWRAAHERARCWTDEEGTIRLRPIPDADSSRLAPLAEANVLVERPPGGETAGKDSLVLYRFI